MLRALLGTLREVTEHNGDAGGLDTSVRGMPDLSQLHRLIDMQTGEDLQISLEMVEHPTDSARQVPPVAAMALYRAVEEALTNVRRHSTARQAQVVVRVEADSYAEVEIVDNGLPIPHSSGTGLGLLGMRERARNAGGLVEAGPRFSGGYRVRMRLPLKGDRK